jgi:phosphate/phosphite/phosphonate ABC transporter binding protein
MGPRDLVTRWAITPRRALLLGSLLVLLGPFGCGEQTRKDRATDGPLAELSPTGTRPRILRIGMTPSSGKNTGEVLAPLVDHLRQRLKMEVTSVTASSYDDLEKLVLDRAIEVGIFSPLSYVKAKGGGLNAVPIATVTRRGSPTYLGYLIVRSADGPHQLGELRGKPIAWVSKSSTSGYLYPRALLRHKGLLEDGESPDDFFGKPLFAGDHKAAILSLYDGDSDVAAVGGPFVDDGRLNPLTAKLGEKGGRAALRVIAKTERIPNDCIVVRDDLARGLAKVLREALLSLAHDDAVSRKLSDTWGMNGFVPPHHEAYEAIDGIAKADGSD